MREENGSRIREERETTERRRLKRDLEEERRELIIIE